MDLWKTYTIHMKFSKDSILTEWRYYFQKDIKNNITAHLSELFGE